MHRVRQSSSQLALLILALLGIADAFYLTLAHYDDQVTLACPNTGFVNCAPVLTSKYSYVPGTELPISVPGMAWCLAVAGLALLGIFLGTERRWLRLAEFFWTLLGMFTILYLVYVEIVLVHNLCLWCTVLHALILLMFLIALVQLPRRPLEDDVEEEEVEEQPIIPSEKF